MYGDHDDGYVSIEECAQRLGISKQRVMQLITARVLKAHWDSYGVMVEPALITGWTA